MMTDMGSYGAGDSVLQRVLNMAMEETISDEQVERVLSEVIRMIESGRIDQKVM